MVCPLSGRGVEFYLMRQWNTAVANIVKVYPNYVLSPYLCVRHCAGLAAGNCNCSADCRVERNREANGKVQRETGNAVATDLLGNKTAPQFLQASVELFLYHTFIYLLINEVLLAPLNGPTTAATESLFPFSLCPTLTLSSRVPYL